MAGHLLLIGKSICVCCLGKCCVCLLRKSKRNLVVSVGGSFMLIPFTCS